MKLPTVAQMQELERRAADDAGLPTLVLMENAGRAVAQAALRLLSGSRGRRVVIVCGKGSNGGDGLCAARHLRNAGVPVRAVLLARDQDVVGDAAVNLKAARAARVEVDNLVGLADVGLRTALAGADLVIDALFGTGMRGPAVGMPARTIEAMNDCGVPVLSVDVPSGLDADSGRAEGPCVRAAATVAMGLPKIGTVVYPGAQHCGALFVGDIGLPRALVAHIPDAAELGAAEDARPLLPARAPDSHKGAYGRVLIVGGSVRYPGAVRLAALGALRAGAGLVRLAVPSAVHGAASAWPLESMPSGFPDRDGAFDESSLPGLLDLAGDADVVALGPGLSTAGGVAAIVHEFVRACDRPMVVDADAINVLQGQHGALRAAKAPVILTPHPGELARLLGLPTVEIQRGRVQAARSAARLTGAVLVLKGARTVVADTGTAVRVVASGNPGMASGGMGDVLTGAIAALVGQGLTPFDAAWVGAYLHGAAADRLARARGDRGLLAHEVADQLPDTIRAVHDGATESPFLELNAVGTV
jgi:NAD(P)H-hydrate epimerase